MAEWARLVHTTITNYLREEEPAILRNRKLTALMEKKGRTEMNCSGVNMDWEVRYKRSTLTGYADMDPVLFQRKDFWKNASLDWRGYNVSDAVSKKEVLENRGTEALVKIFDRSGQRLKEDAMEDFANKFYLDGNASGNEKEIHGIESFMGAGSTLGFVKTPSDTYANLTTGPGDYGGNANKGSLEWPEGTPDAHYDFWSPIILDSTATSFASGATWGTYGVEIVRKGLLLAQRNANQDSILDLLLLGQPYYYSFLNLLDDKERIQVQRGAESSELVAMGFRDVVNQDGTDITWEFTVPAGTIGYGWNVKKMKLMSLQGQLLVVDGPEYDINRKVWKIAADFFGNLRFKSPRYFLKIV